MKTRHTLSAILAAMLTFAALPARATSEHEYAKDEYAIIRAGLAPNKQMSLAAHGDGNGGRDSFHIWLMAEPAHWKIAALDDINSSNNLDTGPDAYHAVWSADSRHVGVYFRTARHAVKLNLYQVESRRAHLVSGPSLFKDLTSREVGRGDDLRRSEPEIEWRGGTRFVLREYRLFLTDDPGFTRMLGSYGKVTGKANDGRSFVEFSAEADCILMPGNRYRIVDLRVGKFRGQ
jgi:hypothetical protein